MKNRKILSAVITAAILVGSVAPSYTVFAESSWTESTAAARAAVEVSTFDALKTAVQTANAQINVTATITVTESIDLNGATLTATGTKAAFGARMIHITGSNVTISNGTINANDIDTYVVDVSGSTGAMTSNSATLDGVTVLNENLDNTGYPSTVTAHSIIRNYGTLTLNNCTVKAGSPAAVKSEEGATLNVRGGSITGKEIGITTYGTTTLSDGTTVSTESGTNALYVLTYSTYDSKTTVNDATVSGTIVYGADSNATKAPEVEIGAAAELVNSGFTKATNSTMSTVPAGTALSIDPAASVQLASTTGLDPILIDALKDVENITDSDGHSVAVSENGTVTVVTVTASKVPTGYVGLTLTANAGGNIYGVTMTEAQLKALGFSEADPSIGRIEAGYYPGFYVDALNTAENGGNATYARTFTYVADLNDATITGLAYDAGSSTDGQFWPCIRKSYLNLTGKEDKPILVYAVKATYDDSDVKYYYIAVDLRDIPDDFTFNDPGSCADDHTADTACPICGNYAKVEVKNTTAADANGSITIKDADGKTVTEAAKNDKITITVTPDEGYVLDKLEINGTAAEVTGSTYTHTMLGVATTVKATFKEIAVESVSLDEETLALTVGGDKTLTATVLPATAKDKTVTWSSNKPEIAKVDQTGKVTAVAAGEATITVTTTDGAKTAACAVTVTATAVAVESVSLDKTTAELKVGETADLTATVLPATATDKTVTWSSDKPEIAKVEDGKVTAVAAGTATVTVTTKDGAKTATCTVTVTEKKTEVTVKLDKETLELAVGKSETITATVTPDTETVTWKSSDTSIATVVNGKIIGVKAGTADITATCGEVTATCKVTVTEEKKEDETVTLKAGEQKTIVTKTDAAAKTRTENTVLVIPAATAEGYAGVKVTVTAGTWTKTSGLIKTCYAKIVHTDADGVKTTVDAGSDFLIAVEVTDIPDGVTVTYSFAAANE